MEPDGPPRPGFVTTIRAIPTNVPSPELWLLGSGDSGGAVKAAERGLGFAFAHYMNPDEVAPVLRRYTGADEVMVLTHTHDHEARMRSYELLAEALASPEGGRALRRGHGCRRVNG